MSSDRHQSTDVGWITCSTVTSTVEQVLTSALESFALIPFALRRLMRFLGVTELAVVSAPLIPSRSERRLDKERRFFMRRFSFGLIAVTIVISSFSSGAPAARAGSAGEPVYVALGDSLAVGYQPGRGETREGYVNELWGSVRESIPALARRNFGCAGETSRSMITGDHSPCEYVAGSQLDAAVAFLERHRGRVPFITIDVGSNDVFNKCVDFDSGVLDRACVAELLTRLGDRLKRIVAALRAAAGPDVPVVGMTYYDPLLGFWGLIPHGRRIARVDERAWEVFDAGLARAYDGAGAVVADVAATFRIDDFSDTAMVDGRRVPINVALTCRWTWFCSKKFFGDPHPNATGYRKIARTFERELRSLRA
jgi:lysophospholipase L1-like esterase